MDLTILNARAEHNCRACSWDSWLTDAPPHTCRTQPATPRDVLEDRVRAARAVFARRELAIREARMAEITMSRRGRI